MRARSRVAAAAIVAGSFGVIGCNSVYWPTAPDSNWTIHDTARFSLYTRPGSFCRTVVDELGDIVEDQYDHAARTLGVPSSSRISIFLYNSGAEVSPPLPSDRSGVAFPHTAAVHAVCVPPLDDNLASLITHEVNHVVIVQGLGTAGTSFMNEGLASALISERRSPIGPSFLYAWTGSRRNQLPSIASLADDARWSSSSEFGYKTSASFLAWLLEQYGRERLTQLYPARSAEIAERTEALYGKSLQELEGEWLAFLARTPTTAAAPARAGAR
jgi:hypothetical protein